jgi:hypothetical protein
VHLVGSYYTDIRIEYVIFLPSHGNNVHAQVPHCYSDSYTACLLLELHLRNTVGTKLLDRDLAAQAQIYSMVFAF